MVFLHPEFLWGLWAIIIPIIIHLFDFRKNKKVYFPDISFLKQVQHSSKKPLRLKQILILFSRIGFISFLVFVFAQPILSTNATNKLHNGVKLIYVDNSQSMSALLASNEAGLVAAKSIAQEISNKLPKGQEVVVVDNTSFGKHLMPGSTKKSLEKIANIVYTQQPFSMGQLTLAITNLAQQSTLISDAFIISDFQKSTTASYGSKGDTLQSFWVANLQPKSNLNCVVDSVYVISEDISAGEPRKIEVIIKNYGDQKQEALPIKIFLEDRQVSAATLDIPAYQTKRISFSLGTVSQSQSGYIQLEDYPNTFDNVFYFSLPKQKRIRVFEIQGDAPSTFIKSVFGNKKLFAFYANNHQNIDANVLSNADFIILNQIENPSKELLAQVKKYAQNGGTVLVIPSTVFSAQSYHILYGKLVKTTSQKQQKLGTPVVNTPFFKGVLEKMTGNFEMPTATPVWDWGQDRSAILAFEDGSPYLSELTKNIYFLRSPLIDSMSSFQTHALFVPVMYKLAANFRSPSPQLFYRINNDAFFVELDSVALKDIIKLVKDDMEIIPSKVKVGNKWKLSVPNEILTVGNYQLMVGQKIIGWLAINSIKAESDLKSFNKAEIEKLFEPNTVHFIDSFSANPTNLISFDGGITLWKYALIICLLFLLSETLLIRFL